MPRPLCPLELFGLLYHVNANDHKRHMLQYVLKKLFNCTRNVLPSVGSPCTFSFEFSKQPTWLTESFIELEGIAQPQSWNFQSWLCIRIVKRCRKATVFLQGVSFERSLWSARTMFYNIVFRVAIYDSIKIPLSVENARGIPFTSIVLGFWLSISGDDLASDSVVIGTEETFNSIWPWVITIDSGGDSSVSVRAVGADGLKKASIFGKTNRLRSSYSFLFRFWYLGVCNWKPFWRRRKTELKRQ